jgi:hypothetical protein
MATARSAALRSVIGPNSEAGGGCCFVKFEVWHRPNVEVRAEQEREERDQKVIRSSGFPPGSAWTPFGNHRIE